jgi:hypothetical protein
MLTLYLRTDYSGLMRLVNKIRITNIERYVGDDIFVGGHIDGKQCNLTYTTTRTNGTVADFRVYYEKENQWLKFLIRVESYLDLQKEIEKEI